MVRLDRRIVTLLRVALGAAFLMAAWPKLQDPEAFARSISNYHLLPEAAGRVLALVLPPLELLVGICLVLGLLDAGAAVLTVGMLVVFTSAIGIAVARGLDISCGCFDTDGGTKVGVAKLVENAGLILASVVVWRGDRSWLSLRVVMRR